MPEDLMERAIELDSGEHKIWQINRGLLSPLYLPDPQTLLTLPEGERRWQVFDFSIGAQKTINLTVNFGTRAWILALMGSYDQAAGFKASLYDAKKKRYLGTTREYGFNLVGTAKNPSWFPTPQELEPNSPLFLRITNLATATATGEIVLYTHLELHGLRLS